MSTYLIDFVSTLATENKEQFKQLYDLFFNDEGETRDDFDKNYKKWLNVMCDRAQVPKGPFRGGWIKDMMCENAQEEVIDCFITYAPDNDEEQVEEENEIDLAAGTEIKIKTNDEIEKISKELQEDPTKQVRVVCCNKLVPGEDVVVSSEATLICHDCW